MLSVIGQGIAAGAGTGLHALGAARRSLRITVLGSVLFVIGSLAGAVARGAAGAVWGTAIALWISALYGWWQLGVAQREAGHLPAGQRFFSIRPKWRRGASPVSAAVPWPDLTVPVRRLQMRRAAARALLAAGGVALLAVIAAVGWTLPHHLTGTNSADGAHAQTTGAPARDGATGSAPVITNRGERAQALKPVSSVSFDPYGDGLGEYNQLAQLAIDGNPATAWHTKWYASASFDELKPGTGLLLDMGDTVTISTVRVLLGRLPGADFQVRVGAVASLTDLHPVAYASDAGGLVSLDLTNPARGRYVLIWFTQLPPADASSGTFQASVYNVSLEGWA
jgi:hypothetical protein